MTNIVHIDACCAAAMGDRGPIDQYYAEHHRALHVVEPPTLLLIKTHRLRCAQCKVWLGRLPQWDGECLGKGWSCEHCGNTSTETFEGRPYGPRSVFWEPLRKEFYDLFPIWDTEDERRWFLSTVVIAPS